MYKACIFDLDGTLTDTLDSMTYSVNETLKELHLKPITTEQCRRFVGDGARCLMERALKAAGDEELRLIEEAMQMYLRIFGENCTYKVRPYEGIVDLLEVLKQRGIKLAVVSNKPHLQTVHVVREIFGDAIFDQVQGQCEEIKRKPSPDGVRLVLDQMNVRAKEAVYIGDSDVDMMTGKAAGAFTVGVNWGFREEALLREVGADQIIGHADELLKLLS